MRRIAAYSLSIVTVIVVGCHDQKPKAEPIEQADVGYGSLQPDLYVTDSSATTSYPEPEPHPSGYESGAVTYETQTIPLAATTASSGRYHTVAKGDTLFGLARRYYGDASRWKDIYEHNRGVLSNPNMLRVGQELAIP